MRVRKCKFPNECQLAPSLVTADFNDAYEAPVSNFERSALAIWLDTVKLTPVWIEKAMHFRNAVVSRLGLKDLGGLSVFNPALSALDYKIGDRIGVFTLDYLSENEIVLSDSDKHLDVKLSLMKLDAGRRIVVSTVVHIHNFLGHLYMVPVKPMHRIIIQTMLRKA